MTQIEIIKGNNLIRIFEGYVHYEKVLIDNSDCGRIYGWARIYSKVPIPIYDYDTQKYLHDDYYKQELYLKSIWGPLEYHKDWNKLMSIVEKIEMLEIELPEIYKKGWLKNSTHGSTILHVLYDCREEFKGWISDVSLEGSHPYIFDSLNTNEKRFKTKKEATYKAVIEFIKWYNANKITN